LLNWFSKKPTTHTPPPPTPLSFMFFIFPLSFSIYTYYCKKYSYNSCFSIYCCNVSSEHLSSPPDLSGVRVARSLVSCVRICRSVFVRFLLVYVLPVCIRFTASGHPFVIFKLFFVYLVSDPFC
jgi:hypothetical protein